jgi:LysM repeat protein
MYRRIDGVNLAHDKMKVRVAATNEEALDEISKELAGRYIKKADYKRSDSSFQSGKVYGKELATKRRTKQDVEDARKHNRDSFKREKGINTAVNKLTGRAKVQANEEVMKESIKAKLFARHMKEDQSFKSAQVIEANAFDLGKTVPDTSMKIRGGAYPSVAARIKDMATAAKGIAGAVRGLAKGFGNPVTAGAMIAAEPTPANSGENEFARQAKYAPKTATSAPAATPKPAAPAPTPTAAPTSAPAKPGFYKGGSQGDYTIKKGDTLSSIAKNTGQNVADLAKMNNISDVNKISSGAKLMTKVPTPPSRPADATPTPAPAAPAPKPAEPEFKGRMIPPSDSGVGATPPAASFVNSRREMRSGGPATAPLTSKDFSRQPPSSMQECVQVGDNKYRIV